MDNNDERIYKAHNNMFVKAFSDRENVRVFLDMVLPEPLREAIDLSQIHLEFTNCISDKLKDAFSDLVIKTVIKTSASQPVETDIYFLMEHKSYKDDKTLIQVLKYMYLEWQKDADQGKPLRVIIPLIFYHGQRNWDVPRSFVDNFEVSDTLKPFLLNFSYVFFDTRDWDFRAAANQGLKENVYLLTTLILMQNAFNDNQEIMSEIFKLWHQKGFTDFKEKVIACMVYMTEIRDISLVQLKKSLEENKIEGGEIMQSLAQVLRNEGKEIGMNIGIQNGKKENAKEVAMSLLNDNYPIEFIMKHTRLTEQEIRALMS